MIIEGSRGEPKIIMKDVPCPLCDYVAENIFQLQNHFDIIHPMPPTFWAHSGKSYKNLFKQIKKRQNSEKV